MRPVGRLPVELHRVDQLSAAEVDLPPLVVGFFRAPAGGDVAVVGLVRLEPGFLDAGGGRGLVQGQVAARRRLLRRRRDALDRAAQVRVEEVALWADQEFDRAVRAGVESLDFRRVGEAVRPRQHHPDAVAGVVGEEERAVVGGREGARLGEGDARDRRAADRAGLAFDHLGRVVVGEVRRGRGAGAVEALADVEVGEVIAGLRGDALVAGPAEVGGGAARRVGDPVDLLPVVHADVADPGFVGARPDRHPERVSQAEGDDPLLVRVAAGRERVAGHAGAGVGIDAKDRAAEAGRVRGRARVLAAQRASLRRRGGEGGAGFARRVAARVDRVPLLAPVGEVEAGSLAATDVELAVGAEGQVADRVARVLLAPVGDQVRLRRHRVAGDRQFRQPTGDHAAVGGRPGRSRAGVAVDAGRSPARRVAAGNGVAGVEDIHIGAGREQRVEHHPQQPAVPEVVDVGAQVGDGRRGVVVEPVELFDHTGLLGDEDAAVRGEGERARFRQPGKGDGVLEATGHRPPGVSQLGAKKHESENRQQQARGTPSHIYDFPPKLCFLRFAT